MVNQGTNRCPSDFNLSFHTLLKVAEFVYRSSASLIVGMTISK